MDEKDPEVIRELIELIRKVGGLDRLEEQLRLRLSLTENTSVPSGKTTANSRGATTASPISQSFYEKIFNNRNASAAGRQIVRASLTNADSDIPIVQRQNKENKYSSVIRNGRPEPQNEGIDKLDESDVVIKERPQYVILTRTSPKTKTDDADDEKDIEDEDDEEETIIDEDLGNRFTSNNGNTAKYQTTQAQYVMIRRNRPSTTESTTIDEDIDDDDSISSSEAPNRSTNQYISINRSRPTKPQEVAEREEISTTTDNKYDQIEY